MLAVRYGRTDITDILLTGGCNVDIQESVSPPCSIDSILYIWACHLIMTTHLASTIYITNCEVCIHCAILCTVCGTK